MVIQKTLKTPGCTYIFVYSFTNHLTAGERNKKVRGAPNSLKSKTPNVTGFRM